MKRVLAMILAVVGMTLLARAANAAASSGATLYGSIRGAVYEDVDGDGRCIGTGVSGEKPIPGVDITFSNSGTTLMLYTGADGTYGFVTAAHGLWLVTVRPDPSLWAVASLNPLHIAVSQVDGLVQTDVNFCLRRVDNAAEGNATGAASNDPSVVSEALLTNPPSPQPALNLDQIAVTEAEELVPPSDWLTYLNAFREIGGLAPLIESEPLSYGSQWHSRYMVVNDQPIAHSEDPQNPLFDPAGNQAGRNGNIFATTQSEADYIWSLNFWVSGPFHLVPMLDPRLAEVGFGSYSEAVGTFHMAAVLDVRSAPGQAANGAQYPLLFPGDGTETWIVRHSLYEWPDPVTSCPGLKRPVGAPIILQLGSGDLTPSVSRHLLTVDGHAVESCRFDETTYVNPDPYAQQVGRVILDERDAIVIIPRDPMPIGKTVEVEVEVNGETINWSFGTRPAP